MSEAKVPDYDTCGLFHRLHCIKTLASRPVLICKSYYFFCNRKKAAGILSYSQFRFFVYFTFLFELGKSKDILKYICLIFISFLPLFYLCCIYYFGLLIFCCHFIITALKLLRNHYFENTLQATPVLRPMRLLMHSL